MKKIRVFISFFILMSLFSIGQSPWFIDHFKREKRFNPYAVAELGYIQNDTINKVDAQGRRKGYWKISIYDSASNSDFIESEGRYRYGSRIGDWKYYYANGALRGIGYFIDDYLIGPYETYYQDGSVREKGNWHKDHAVGNYQHLSVDLIRKEINYDANGKLIEHIKYSKSGKVVFKENDSVKISFHPNGISSSVDHLKNGKLNGYSYAYDEKGIMTKKISYENDLMHGPFSIYHKNGTIMMQGNYKNGHLYGERIYYNKDGSPVNGNFTFFYENGNKQREGYCINGKPEGLVKLYSSDNSLTTTVNHKDGKPDGAHTFYNSKGTCFKVDIYKDGEFIESKMPYSVEPNKNK